MKQQPKSKSQDEIQPSVCNCGSVCPAYPRCRHPEDVREHRRSGRRHEDATSSFARRN